MQPDQLLQDLEAIVGPDHVLVEPGLRASFETDWTGRFRGHAMAVVRPGTATEVQAVVRACRTAGVGIVPQGGNTGLVGGATPPPGTVVVTTTRLAALGAVDALSGEIVAGAGVTLARLGAHVREAGLELAVDFAARDSATVGGIVATNAGGIHVLRYGTTREQVAGIEAVLGDGSLVSRLAAPRKDNTGYALASLLCGSEGTLGIVTAARLRLVPRLPRRVVAVVGAAGVDAAVRLAARLRDRLPALDAAELFLDDGLDLVVRNQAGLRPFATRAGAYLLVEIADTRDPEPDLVDALADADEVLDAAVATDATARERLWLLREGHADAIAREGVPHKIDVAVPVGAIAAFVDGVRRRVETAAPGSRTVLFGHLLDGNLHVNVLGPAPDDEAADDAVIRLALELGGTISAEHGVGRAKTRWLSLDRRAEDVAAMRAIKRALDPDGILNPGVLLG